MHTGRIVLTVHDIQPLDLPEHFAAVKRRYLAALLPPSVRSAELIVTTSAFVVDRLVERLGAERDRCRVVAPVLHRRSAPDAARVAEVRSRLGCLSTTCCTRRSPTPTRTTGRCSTLAPLHWPR
ncbi:MAG: hypothetical protein R2749_29425 [Acidimicrobiales bacterium]